MSSKRHRKQRAEETDSLWGLRVGDPCRVRCWESFPGGKTREVWVIGEVVRLSGTSPITRDRPQMAVRTIDTLTGEFGEPQWIRDPEDVRAHDDPGPVQ